MKTGLILEGGAMRGLFTAGVIDVFLENDIVFDGMIGVSAGAAFGCNYKSKQNGRVLRYNLKYCRDKRYCSFRSLLMTGDMYGADFCYKELPEKLDIFDNDTFNKNPMKFYVVCTDIKTGKAFYKECSNTKDDYLEYIRASASMPLVSRIVNIGENKYLDGGIADSVPLKYFESIGYDRNVVVLTQPKGYQKKKNSLMPLAKAVLRKYPKMLETMAKRHIVYNETTNYIEGKEKNGEILVIRPAKSLGVKHAEHSSEKLRAAYEEGRRAALEKLPEIKSFLS